jgi:hypothetical protein
MRAAKCVAVSFVLLVVIAASAQCLALCISGSCGGVQGDAGGKRLPPCHHRHDRQPNNGSPLCAASMLIAESRMPFVRSTGVLHIGTVADLSAMGVQNAVSPPSPICIRQFSPPPNPLSTAALVLRI